MPISRLRFRDARSTLTSIERTDQFSTATCGTAASWKNIYTSGDIVTTSGTYAHMRDVVIPGYFRRSARGEVFFNSMERAEATINYGTGTFQEIESSSVSCSGYPTAYKQRRRCYLTGGHTLGRKASNLGIELNPDKTLILPGLLVPFGDYESMVREAVTQAESERGRSDANLWEALAELDQSLGLVSNALLAIKKLAVSRQSKLKKAKAAANAYLLWRYGISPLYSDLSKALKGLNAQVGRLRQTSRGSVSTSTSVESIAPAAGWDYTTYAGKFINTELISIRVGILDETTASFSSNVGFSFKDLATLPWELIPMSFVADWFVNIGDLLGSLVPVVGAKRLGDFITVGRKRTIQYTTTSVAAYGGYNVVSAPTASAECVYDIITRTPIFSGPGLVLRSDFRLSNLTRALDATALLAQLFKPLPKGKSLKTYTE